MALLGRTVLLSVQNINGDDFTDQNGGSPVGVALVTGEDVKGSTINARVFLDGPNTVRVQNVPVANVEPVAAPASKS